MSGGNGTKILVRPRTGRILAGICAGIAGYSGVDVTLVRVIVTVVSVLHRRHRSPGLPGGVDDHPRRRREDLDRPGHPRQEAERLIGLATARPAAERKLDMDPTDPIRRVSVVSTGQVQIRPDHLASTWRPTLWWLLASRRWTGSRPINAYVIEHRDGLVLFDAGQDRASVTDPGYFPGGMTGVLYRRPARFAIGPTETLTAGLDRLGYAAGDVRTAVLSHLRHTPGSISLLVRRPGRPALMMVGDVTYDADLLELGHVPGVGSRRGLRDSTAMINTMRRRDPGLVILPAHDPAAASRLAQATGQVPTLATV
jgi:glyoxylase-like metal-dependent hydrolase (beta-lactamase superfamily II)